MEIGEAELLRARDAGTPDAELSRLAATVHAAFRARSPNAYTPVENAVLVAIAGNPNTPPALLFSLALEHASEVVQNPALVLLTLENPGVVASIPQRSLIAILTRPDAPSEWLALAAQRGEPFISTLVASHPRTPPEVLVRLGGSSWSKLRIAVAGNPSTPPELLAHFARTQDEAGPTMQELRIAVACNPSTPLSTLEHLAEDPSILCWIARNPSLPEYLFDVLAEYPDMWVRSGLATQARLPARIARRLAADPESEVRLHLAQYAVNAEALQRCVAEGGDQLLAVAKNPNAFDALLRRIARSPRGKARAAAEKVLAERAAKSP